MNNIQKNFKMKSRLRGLADGGQPNMLQRGAKAVGDYVGEIGPAWSESNAQFEATDPSFAQRMDRAAQAPTFAANAPQRWGDGYDVRQTAAKKRESESALRGLADGGGIFPPVDPVDGEAQLVAQLAQQGVSGGAPVPTFDGLEPPEYELEHGGLVAGKGGPTDDLVGPVALSNKEYVLPADTVEIVGRDNLDKLRLKTHDFQDPEAKIAATGGLPQPVKGSALRGLADGGTNWRVDRTGTARPVAGNSLVPAGSRPIPGTSVGPATVPPGAAGTPNWNVSSDGTARPSSGNSVGPARVQPNTFDGTFERVNPNQPRIGTPQAAPSSASTASTAVPSAAPSAAPAKQSLLRRAGKGAAKLAVPLTVAGGVAQTVDDAASGYQDEFNRNTFNPDTKYDGSFGDMATRVAADTGNVLANALSNIGDTATFGYAGKLGRGLSSLTSGGDFLDGWGSESARDKFLERKANESVPEAEETAPAQQELAPNSAPVEQDSAESKRLEQMGVAPEDQNAGVVPDAQRNSVLRNTEGNIPGQMTNFGTLGGNGNIYGTATEEGGRINSFSGVGRGTRQAPQPGDPGFMRYGGGTPTTRGGSYMDGVREWGTGTPALSGQDAARQSEVDRINQRFARMENRLHNTYGEKNPGLLTRKLAVMERDRASQLQGLRASDDARYDTDSRADASRYAADSSLRGYQERTAATAANSRLDAAYKALEAQAAAEDRANAQSEKGVADMDKYIATTFDDDPDRGKEFRAFVDSADPGEIGELTRLYGGNRRRALDEMKERMEQRDIVNEAQNWATGRQSSLHSPVAYTQNPKWLEDMMNGVGAWDSTFNKLGELTGAGAGGQVRVLEDGRRVSASKLGGDDRRLRSIRDQMARDPSRQ